MLAKIVQIIHAYNIKSSVFEGYDGPAIKA
jgi:hypothetical protein